MKNLRKPPAISNLLRLCCPAAVRWLVVAVVVYAVQGMLRVWVASHVGQEVLVRPPTLTDLNPATPVVGPPISFRIQTSIKHGCPGLVFSRAPCFSMFPTTTPATFSSSYTEMGSTSNKLFPAMAQTAPSCGPVRAIGCAGDNKKRPETLSSHINKFRLQDNGRITVQPGAVIVHSAKGFGVEGLPAASHGARMFHVTTIHSVGAVV